MIHMFPMNIRSVDEDTQLGANFVLDPANLATAASLAAQVWETVIWLPDEVEHLWRGKLGVVKMLYGLSRYLMLLGQITNQILSVYLFAYPQTADTTVCRGKMISQAVFTQIGLSLMEVVIILRVLALYSQKPRIKIFLLGVFTISTSLELCGSGIFISITARALECRFTGEKNVSIYFFCAGAVFGQTVLVAAMLIGLIMRHRSGKSRTALVSMLLNQGLATFVLVLALVTSMMIYNFFPRFGMQEVNAMLSWYNALLSIGTCRLLLQMRKLGAQEASGNDPRGDDMERHSSIIFTSVITESCYPATSAYPASATRSTAESK